MCLHIGQERAILAPLAAGNGPLFLVHALVGGIFVVVPEPDGHEVAKVFSSPATGAGSCGRVRELGIPGGHVALGTGDVLRVLAHHGVVVLCSI